MTNHQWNPAAFKTLLKATSLRLAQLQERKHFQSQITRRDIATLLNAGNIPLARVKAQNLVQDEVMGGVFSVLETCVGVLHERMGELELDRSGKTLSLATVEAASTVIYAARSIQSKDISLVRDVLVNRLVVHLHIQHRRIVEVTATDLQDLADCVSESQKQREDNGSLTEVSTKDSCTCLCCR